MPSTLSSAASSTARLLRRQQHRRPQRERQILGLLDEQEAAKAYISYGHDGSGEFPAAKN